MLSLAGESHVQKASAFAAFAAAALLQASPASAGVVLQQPQIKKVSRSNARVSALEIVQLQLQTIWLCFGN